MPVFRKDHAPTKTLDRDPIQPDRIMVWRFDSFEAIAMKLPSWLTVRRLRTPRSRRSLTQCPTCGRDMTMTDRSSMTGDDMRTYYCGHCRKEHIVDFGVATWKAMSDARKADEES
jgi:predicted RNA-binding Zn-ribbon protein involved in translation (DUF1610 family)